MKKLMNKLFLSCLKASEMIEKKWHFKLNLREKVQLKMHIAMCKACGLYEKQSIMLEKGIEASMHEHSHGNTEKLEKQIIDKLEESSF